MTLIDCGIKKNKKPKKNKMKYLNFIVLLSCVAVLFSCKSEADKKTKVTIQPNIVVILCDDLGYGDLSSYGHPVIETPNIDNLANTGMKLTNFYAAAPVCSPSRVGLLTGRSPNKAGVYDFIVSGRKKRDDNRDMVHLQAYEETIPARLKSVGYDTCLVGKWHCSSLFNSKEQPKPNELGFDYWFATHNNASPSHENPKNFVRNGQDVGEIEGFSCQIVVDEAMDWLNKKKDDNPFFLQVAFHEPHVPVQSPPELVQKYLPYAKNENEAQFFANVANVDIAVGRLVKYLEKNNAENTIIIFTSDNGPETLLRYEKAYRSYGSPGELKGMKLWTNEAGFRVPCIINWMGNETYVGTSDAVVSALDFMPTFCELTGAVLPQNKLDGESITTFLNNGEFEREKPLIWSFYNAENDRIIAMRDGDWKIMAQLKNDDVYLPKIFNVYDGNETYIKESELADFVLYNLSDDIGESTDLSLKYPEVFEKMKATLGVEYGALLDESFIWRREE